MSQTTFTRAEAEDLLTHEARLLDERRLEEWNALFTAEGMYWIPLDEEAPFEHNAAIVRDTPLRREERVHHLLHNYFPAQSPPSRTLHFVSNVAVEAGSDEWAGCVVVRSNQIVYEMRTGDYKQVGVGELRPIVAAVEHILRPEAGARGGMGIARKKIVLINHDSWLGNMTFLM